MKTQTKHTPLIKLQRLNDDYRFAQDDCPHWDYEGFNTEWLKACCYHLDETGHKYREALRKYKKQKGEN